jgi:opacity protein-like surface antigen
MRNLILPLFCAAALTASAQTFSFGVKAGAPVTSALPYDASPYSMVDTGRWTVGPTAEVRLFGHLSVEADALFRGYHSQSSGGSIILAGFSLVNLHTVPVSAFFRQSTKEWDFPLLLKYRFQTGRMHPFVDAGFEFAHASSDFTISCLAGPATCSAAGIGSSVTSQNSYSSSVNRQGPAAGAGIEFKFGKVKISPEVRYTKLTRPNANEVTVLAGFTF